MAYQIRLPDGSLAWIADNVPQDKALEIAKGAYPDAFPPPPEPPGVISQILGAPKEIAKGFARGITVDPLSGVSSLAYTGARAAGADITPFEQTGFGKGLSAAQTYLAPSDEGLITQGAGGLGSLLSYIPGGLLKGGLKLATLGTQAMGMGSEEARSRAEQARLSGEADATAGQQFVSQIGGSGVGLTELAPLGRLMKPLEAIFGGIKKSDAEKIAPGLFNSAQRMLATGGIEGLQEGMANIAQDLIAKGIYNPNLDVGESALGDAAMGASVGAFAQGALELLTRGRRTAIYEQLKGQELQKAEDDKNAALRAEELKNINQVKQNLGISGSGILALPAPAKQLDDQQKQDPLLNPVGLFNEDQLDPRYVNAVNDRRQAEGKSKLNQFSLEDLVDAGAPQGEIDRLITAKTGPSTRAISATQVENVWNPQDVLNVAETKNIDTTTVGFNDFLRRVSGTENLKNMSQAQLFSAFNALDALDPSDTLRILPRGTNATRFNDTQYNQALRYVSDSLKSGAEGQSSIVKQIKDSTNLTNDRDAQSLLETAIDKGDLVSYSTPGYIAVDGNGNQVGVIYKDRNMAIDYAKRNGLSVRDSTSINVSLPGQITQMPGLPDVREGTFQTGTKPSGFQVRIGSKRDGPVLNTQEAAEERAAAIVEKRKSSIANLQGQITQEQNNIKKSTDNLVQMEADGQSDTDEYKRRSARIAIDQKRRQSKIERLQAEIEGKLQLPEIEARFNNPTTRTGYTLFDQGSPVATFPSQDAAFKQAVANLNDKDLQIVASLGRFQPGARTKSLSKYATEEMDRRSGKVPEAKGIGIQITGTREEAEAKLAEAGIRVNYSQAVQEKIKELEKKLLPALEKLGLKDVGLRIIKSIKANQETGDGSYASRLITIALDAKNPLGVLRHESIHALKELGAFTDAEWKVLLNKARSEWVDKYLKSRTTEAGENLYDAYREQYKNYANPEEAVLEEAIAEAFRNFGDKRPPGMIGNIMYRLNKFFASLGNAFRGLGFQTSDSVFQRIDAGQMTRREPTNIAGERYSLKFEDTADVEPLDIQQVRIYEKELESLIKKLGNRIVGMKSEETLDDVRKAVKKLQSYTEQGIKGKEWYERSSKAVLDAFNGDPVLAEKFFQIIAITSANTEVAANFTKTLNAWNQFATDKPIKVGTENENKKINALLNFGEDWEGRKTNSFYTNLMEAMDGKDTGRSTIDLHMTRLLFDKDAPTDAQYELAENMVRLLASKVGLPARQVQASAWVTQKAKTIFDDYRNRGWKKGLNDEQLREFAFERAIADYSHLMKAKVEKLPVTDALRELSSSIQARVQTITGEVIPSVETEMAEVDDIAYEAKEKLTKDIAKANFVQDIANDLGVTSKIRVTVGSGAYKGKVNPNLIVQVVNDNPEAAKEDARLLSNAMSYVFKQDASPFFRADPALLGTGQLGFRLKFGKLLTPAQQKKIVSLFNNRFGQDAGFSRVRANEIVIINYRGEDGNPYMTTDDDFVNGLAELSGEISKISNIESQGIFGAESEYPYHDWKQDTSGTGIIQRIYDNRPQRPDIQGRLDNYRESFVNRARGAVESTGRDPRFSLRSNEIVGGPSIGGGVSIREQQPNAQSFDAVHYGKQRVNSLAGSLYGTGIKGAEAPRVFASPDPRVRQRAYFYVPYPGGRMPMPESGLGNEVHVQRLNNLLGPGDNMQALVEATRSPDGKFDPNAFESAVIDAGFDGYAVPDMGMAVVLGADVPVISRGTRQEVAARPAEDSVQIGDRRYSLRQTDTPEFKQWFDDSSIVKDDGAPKMMYHGTSRDITKFRPKQASAIFLTDSPRFAESFSVSSEDYMIREYMDSATPEQQSEIIEKAIAKGLKDKDILPSAVESLRTMPLYQAANTVGVGDYIRELVKNELPSNQNIMPLYVSAKDVFDYENPSHVRRLSYVIEMDDVMIEEVSDGDWGTIESEDVQEAIRELFADGFYVKEGGKKNLAVFRPEQIKSAIGNIGTFSRTDKDIRYALALGNIEPSTAVVPDIGGNPNGNMGLLPPRLGSKPIRLLVGTHDDIEDKGYGANHILTRVLSDPRRMPEGAEELLEKIARTAQRTAQNYNRIYQDGNKLVLFDGKNSLIISSTPNESSIVTMFKQSNPEQKYGRPVWNGRAPSLAEFVEPVRGMSVEARDGRVAPKSVAVTKKRVVTPSGVLEAAPVSKGTLGLKKMALRVSETSEFKDWFKDSKAVDESGKPLVMYHGTKYVFDEFKISKDGGSLGSGIYLTPSTGFASDYAVEENANVIPLYASIQKPLIIDGSISRDPMIEAFVRLGVDRNKAENIVEKAYEDKGYITNEVRSRATKQGFDGIFQYKDGKLSEVVAFNPTQIKSIYNQEPSAESKKFSLRAQPIDQVQTVPQGTVDVEPTGTRDNLIYLLQDKQIDLKRVIEGLRKAGRDIAERWDAYLKEELFHGRSATRIKFFVNRELQPLLKKMEAANISLEQMDDYLLARHAKEANAYIRSINPDPNANAGMTDKQAEDYIKSLPPPRRAALERIANDVYAMTKGTRELMVDYGLENRKTIEAWEKTYKNYVPLFREEIEGDEAKNSYVPISIGRGYNIRGGTTKRRTGSSLKVADVLANIAMQRERIIVRGEKNRVGNALYGLVAGNPNKGLWGVINPEKTNKQVMRNELLELGIDPSMVDEMIARPITKSIKNGMVTYQVPPLWKSAENIFITRVNGEDRFIGFNKNDERAMRMASTLKNLDAQQQGEAIRMMGTAGDYYRKTLESVGKGTRFFASVNTQYNPAFGIYNLMRDIGGAALNLQSTPLKGQEGKVIADSFVALKAIYRDLRRQRDGLAADSKWAEIFEEFELEGGKTGYRDMFEDTQSRAEALQKELTDFQKGNLKGKGKAVMNWLSDFNDAIENSVRVSVYKNAIDKGLSKERAASLAKNITVNFNRTGAVSRNFQTLFAFFNASVQGTARIAQTLLTSEGKLSPAGKKIVMGGITLGLAQSVLLAMAGLDDDEVPDFVKDKAFIIPTGDGKYLAVPMPLGYNIIPGFGRRVMEFAMSDDKNVGKSVFNTSQMLLDGFNPLGSATFVQMLTPTILDPIVALAENKDFTGKPIAREDINSLTPTPGYTRGSQNAFAVTEGLAYAINILTGGSEFKKGAVSPTPDQIEYLVGQVFGGVGREAMKVGRGIESLATGEELATYNIPIAGRLVGNVQQKAAQTNRFYQNVRTLNEHQEEIEGRINKGEDISEYIDRYPEASLYQAGDKIYSRIRKLKDIRKTMQESGADREDLQSIDEAMLGLMSSLNDIYASAKSR